MSQTRRAINNPGNSWVVPAPTGSFRLSQLEPVGSPDSEPKFPTSIHPYRRLAAIPDADLKAQELIGELSLARVQDAL